MAKRFVVECVWSGYRSSQERACHRMVIPKYVADRLSRLRSVTFTDGTDMSVTVRPCTFREKVQQIKGYRELLDKIAWNDELNKKDYVSVMEV